MLYLVYYTCPKCKHPMCGSDPMELANEPVDAKTKAEALAFFNANKPCRHMKACEVKLLECEAKIKRG